MKRIIIVLVLLIVSVFAVKAQVQDLDPKKTDETTLSIFEAPKDLMQLSLEIKNLDGSGFCGNVYLRDDQGRFKCYCCENGIANIIFLKSDYDTCSTSLTIRPNKSDVVNVSLDCLLNSNSVIKLPTISIEAVEYKKVAYLKSELEILQYLSVRCEEGKLFPSQIEYSYFPKKVQRDDSLSIAENCSVYLKRLDEPVLCHNYHKEVYRFTWMSSWFFYEYDPYAVRIEAQEDGSAILFCNYHTYNKGCGCDVFPISSQTFEQFKKMINDIGRKAPTFTGNERLNDVYFCLETKVNGRYHVIFRGEGEDVKLDDLQQFLWNLIGLGNNKRVHNQRWQRIE